jgi:hypothetical protein
MKKKENTRKSEAGSQKTGVKKEQRAESKEQIVLSKGQCIFGNCLPYNVSQTGSMIIGKQMPEGALSFAVGFSQRINEDVVRTGLQPRKANIECRMSNNDCRIEEKENNEHWLTISSMHLAVRNRLALNKKKINSFSYKKTFRNRNMVSCGRLYFRITGSKGLPADSSIQQLV